MVTLVYSIPVYGLYAVARICDYLCGNIWLGRRRQAVGRRWDFQNRASHLRADCLHPTVASSSCSPSSVNYQHLIGTTTGLRAGAGPMLRELATTARMSQEARFTQLRAHYWAQFCHLCSSFYCAGNLVSGDRLTRPHVKMRQAPTGLNFIHQQMSRQKHS